jgi:hypothetical protein
LNPPEQSVTADNFLLSLVLETLDFKNCFFMY